MNEHVDIHSPRAPDESFLQGGGECGALMAERDWSGTLGPVPTWPQSLRTATSLLLASPVPMVMLWGPDGIMLYNDAYSVFAGGRHPDLLGSKVREGWPEVADFNDNVMKVGLSGGTLQYRDQELTLYRHGRAEQVWMNLDYSPVLDESGKPAGVLAIVVETTERVAAGKAMRESETRLREVLDNMGESLAVLDHDYRIVDMNAEALRMDPRSREEIIGKTHWEAYGDASPELGVLYHKAMTERVPVSLDHRYIWPDGRESWIAMRAAPIDTGIAIFYRDISARVARQAALKESEEQLRNLAESVPALVFVADGDGANTYTNSQFQRFAGMEADSLLGSGWLRVIHPEDRARAEATWHASWSEGKPYEAEYRFLRHDGSYRWHTVRGTPLRDDDGTIFQWVGAASDIDEQKRATAALRESESRFSHMADNAPVMIWMTDATGHCVYLNRPWYEFTGQAAGEGEGLGWLEPVHPGDRALAQEAFLTATAEQKDYRIEFRLRRADGVYRWTIDAAAARFDANGAFLGYVGSVIDIEDRRAAEERLAYQEEQLRLAIEAAEIGLWDLDPVKEKLFWPARVKSMFGISADVPVTMDDFYQGVHPDDLERVVGAFEAAIDPKRRSLYDEEYRTIGKDDGIVRWIAAKGRGIFDDQGTCIRVIGTAIDISARKKTEQHQRLLMDELSHRAKNLLAIIQGVAHQSFRGPRSAEDMRSAFEGRLGALGAAHDILTSQRWESAPISELIGATVAAVSAEDGRLRLEGPDVLLPPKTGVSLAMAIHELATNALKYGSLQSSSGTVSVRWWVDGDRLKLEWREQGGPRVEPPSTRGFGTRMIERGLAAELGGKVVMTFDPEGVACLVDAPLPEGA